jgi:hypothetical protein
MVIVKIISSTGPICSEASELCSKNNANTGKGHKMIDKLTFSQRGHAILLGNIGLGLLNGLLVPAKVRECAEDSILDNFITETSKKVYFQAFLKPSTTWNQASIFQLHLIL